MILEFGYDELIRIRLWQFSVRGYREMIPRNFVSLNQRNQSALEQLSENVTRQGFTEFTLKYLKVICQSVVCIEGMRVSNWSVWLVVCHSSANARTHVSEQGILHPSKRLVKDSMWLILNKYFPVHVWLPNAN